MPLARPPSPRPALAAVACAALALLGACSSPGGGRPRAAAPAPAPTTGAPVAAPARRVAARPTTTTLPAAWLVRGGPPRSLWGYGDPLLCGAPTAPEDAGAVAAERASGPLALAPAARHARVLLVGDSTACSLWPGLHAVGAGTGVATFQGAVFGCGIASGEITTTRDEAITPHSSRCVPLVAWALPDALRRARPTVVVWMSAWEKSDLVVGGRTLVAGTAPWQATIDARMDAALALLTAGGARVVAVTEAAPAPNPAQQHETTDARADDAGYVRVDALLERFAARHPGRVSVVDLASRLCPGGPPCPAVVDGMRPRPDGRHLTPVAATWVARWLLAQLFPAR